MKSYRGGRRSGIVEKLISLIRLGNMTRLSYKEFDTNHLDEYKKNHSDYFYRQRVNSTCESSEVYAARHSIANNGVYYFGTRNNFKISFNGPKSCQQNGNRKVLFKRESKSSY